MTTTFEPGARRLTRATQVFALLLCVLAAALASAPSHAQDGPIVDLNSASVEELDDLPGIGRSKAEMIIEWRTSNGGFKTTQDLQKVAGIGLATYSKLCNRIKVGSQQGCGKQDASNMPEEVVEVIDPNEDPRININTASAEDLQVLPGIGPKRAEMIIERRESRGPYRDPSELEEIKGIGPKTLEKLVPFVRVTSDVNQVTVEELLATGVVNRKQAEDIVRYRKRIKRLRMLKQLEKVGGVDAATVSRLSPFLTL